MKWGVAGSIVLLVGFMFAYPKVKDKTIPEPDASPSAQTARRALPVNGIIVKPQLLTEKIFSTGTVLPDEEVDLTFETSGKVVSILFKEGAHVKKGELLAKVNDLPLQAQLRKIESQLPLAQERVFRQKSLLEKDAVSLETYELVATELAKLEADKELVLANIDQTELRAPFDGVIGLRFISEGAFATPTTKVSKLTKVNPLKIDFSFPERYSSSVKKGTPIQFNVDGVLRSLSATVYAVESKIDSKTRTLTARALYANDGDALLPGKYAGIEIQMNEISDALTIPSEALIPEQGEEILFLYRSGVAHPVKVKTGMRTEAAIQLVEGIEVGDTVIVSGVMQLRRGMPVNLVTIK